MNVSRLLGKYRVQHAELERLESVRPGITTVDRSEDGAVIVDDAPPDIEALLREIAGAVGD